MNAVIRCAGVHKTYNFSRPNEVRALANVTLSVKRGSFTLLRGPSGSGKTSLLAILGALDRPSAGAVFYEDTDLSRMTQRRLALLRKKSIGFLFQMNHLLCRVPAWENVSLPLVPDGVAASERRSRAVSLLSSLGLGDRADHAPEELSGGEQQRVAVARALVHDPAVIILDEPTAHADAAAAGMLIDILMKLKSRGKTIVVSSHDEDMISWADEMFELRKGVLAEDEHDG